MQQNVGRSISSGFILKYNKIGKPKVKLETMQKHKIKRNGQKRETSQTEEVTYLDL